MNSQQEYELFMLKIAKAAHDIQDAFDKLSPENKKRFAQRANAFLRGHGVAVTLDELMGKLIG